jgi:type III pantothenate kinase
MLLAVDIGNTYIKLGVFDGDRLLGPWRVGTDPSKLADEYAVLITNLLALEGLDKALIHHAVIASVVPVLSPVFDELCRRYLDAKPLRVAAGVKTGMRVQYEARELGPDRITVALGALRLHPPPLIVVHMGTGTVFEAVSREGDYLGGAIAPGIGVATDALTGRAAMLRSVELRPPARAIGNNSAAAMQSGILFGYAEMIEGMVRRFKAEIGDDAWVIGTGGWVNLMKEVTTCFNYVDENLSLYGLRQVFEMNSGS